MIKRMIVISSKAHISHKDEQLRIAKEEDEPTVPIEDIGVLILESHQATITQSALSALMANNVVVIGCDATHHPDGIMTPIAGNLLHTAVLKDQVQASLPLCKQLWQQTVKAKILNQAAGLKSLGIDFEPMERWARKVRSGDPDNFEGRAASYYWKRFFPAEWNFARSPEGETPNNLLNYAYAVLRAAMARAIVGSGLHPAIGLHHRNQYNPFCLADDLMEPYRPFADVIVRTICIEDKDFGILTPDVKKRLLTVLSVDTWIEEERKPLLLALTNTSSSLVRCLWKESKRLVFPTLTRAGG
jgi:CRISPR-associated protein Cas1